MVYFSNPEERGKMVRGKSAEAKKIKLGHYPFLGSSSQTNKEYAAIERVSSHHG